MDPAAGASAAAVSAPAVPPTDAAGRGGAAPWCAGDIAAFCDAERLPQNYHRLRLPFARLKPFAQAPEQVDADVAKLELQNLVKDPDASVLYCALQPMLRWDAGAAQFRVEEEELLLRQRNGKQNFAVWAALKGDPKDWLDEKRMEMDLALETIRSLPNGRRISINFTREQLSELEQEIIDKFGNGSGQGQKVVVELLEWTGDLSRDEKEFTGRTVELLKGLAAAGVQLSLDDFYADKAWEIAERRSLLKAGAHPASDKYSMNTKFALEVCKHVKQIKLDIKYMTQIFNQQPTVTGMEAMPHQSRQKTYDKVFPTTEILHDDLKALDQAYRQTVREVGDQVKLAEVRGQLHSELKQFIEDAEARNPDIEWVIELSVTDPSVGARFPPLNPFGPEKPKRKVLVQGGPTNDFARHVKLGMQPTDMCVPMLPLRFEDAQLGMDIVMTPSGRQPGEGPAASRFSGKILEKEVESIRVRWNSKKDGGPEDKETETSEVKTWWNEGSGCRYGSRP